MLEKRIDNFQQYSKKDNLVISGLNVQHRTYVRTASNLSIDSYTVQEAGTSEENMLAFLNNHNIPIQESDISICHPLKSKGNSSFILLKCSNRKAKMDVIKSLKEVMSTQMNILLRIIHIWHIKLKNKKRTYNIYMDT